MKAYIVMDRYWGCHESDFHYVANRFHHNNIMVTSIHKFPGDITGETCVGDTSGALQEYHDNWHKC